VNAGDRDKRVVFERATVSKSPMGAEVATWTAIATRWADVRYGTGSERRAAAQEGSSAPATIRVLKDSVTRTLTPRDRAILDGASWDIESVVPFERAGIDITAVRRS
jgi:SPP1 family predicted phage head-tail adaptor